MGHTAESAAAHGTSYGVTGASPYGSFFLAFNGGDTSANSLVSQSLATTADAAYTLSYAYG